MRNSPSSLAKILTVLSTIIIIIMMVTEEPKSKDHGNGYPKKKPIANDYAARE